MKLTPEQILLIKELAASGVQPKEIAKRVECLPSQVTYHCRDLSKQGQSRKGQRPATGAPAPPPDKPDIPDVPILPDPQGGTTAVNVARLRELRDDPRASVGDQIRAADLLMKWQRGIEDDDLQQQLTDEQYEDMIVTMLEELDPKILERVARRVSYLREVFELPA